jgi:NAD(P)-dependent dehydrogenase (short-subunit alcohol dehydrogenase family)
LITGAGSGIGRATAVHFSSLGFHVVLAGRTRATLEATASLCEVAQVVVADMASEESISALFREIAQRHARLDVAVNNAAIEGKIAPIRDISMADYDEVFNINTRGLWICLQHELALMQKAGNGAIVNISSVAGIRGIAQSALYCGTKHAVLGFTRALASEFAATSIRINAVCPGAIRTEMLGRIVDHNFDQMAARQPSRRIGTPEEIAAAVAWLCSPEASFVNGHALVADGSLTAAL